MIKSNSVVLLTSLLFTTGLQIIGRDWSFWTRIGALLIVAPAGTLVGLAILALQATVKG